MFLFTIIFLKVSSNILSKLPKGFKSEFFLTIFTRTLNNLSIKLFL